MVTPASIFHDYYVARAQIVPGSLFDRRASSRLIFFDKNTGRMIVHGQDCKRNLNIGGFKKVGLFCTSSIPLPTDSQCSISP